MCLDAAAMQGIGLLTNVVSTYGNYQNQMQQAAYARQIADAQASAYLQQADIAKQNASIENKKAEIDQDAGADRVAELRRRALSTLGAQRATMGALGLATTDGSPEKILSDTEYLAQLDIEAMRYNNRKVKWGHDVNRVNYLNEAIMNESAAANAKWSGDAQAAFMEQGARSTLLTGIAKSGVDYMDKTGGAVKTKVPSKPSVDAAGTYNRSTGWVRGISTKSRIASAIPSWR